MNEIERIRRICEETCPNETCNKINCFECEEFVRIGTILPLVEALTKFVGKLREALQPTIEMINEIVKIIQEYEKSEEKATVENQQPVLQPLLQENHTKPPDININPCEIDSIEFEKEFRKQWNDSLDMLQGSLTNESKRNV